MVDFIDATDARTNQAVGVALGVDGHPWVNNRSGNAMRVHRDTGEVLRTAQQSTGLYTYSDFTGYQLRNLTAPSGTYFHRFTGCGPGTQWRQLVWDAVVPTGTSLQAHAVAANDPGDLSNPALRKGPFTTQPVDLIAAGVPSGQYLRIEFTLSSSNRQGSPVLQSFNVNYRCP
jgi:hypothetical protein